MPVLPVFPQSAPRWLGGSPGHPTPSPDPASTSSFSELAGSVPTLTLALVFTPGWNPQG